MRRSVAAVCIACFVFPFAAGALGLGEIELESALNEPFAAGIPVTASAAELDGLQVQLASGDTFRRYGIDQPAFLRDFRFGIERDAAGAPVIRITSRSPVAEPFVTLLLDVQWGSGRLLREYTVLLDPPVYASQPVAAPVSPARTEAPASVPAPAAAQPAIREVPPVTAGSATPRGVPAAGLGDSYEVRQRDTLWEIAERARGDGGLTTNQVMLALYQANPDAFMGNINRLKAGSILRIPPAAELAAVPATEATATVRQQNRQFAGGAAATEAPAGGDAGAAAAPARLQLVPPRDTAGDTVTSDAAAPAEQPQLEARTGDAAEASQLRTRLGELEQALGQSERLLQVRDSELQALQQRLAQLEQQLEAAGEAIPEPEPFADEVAQQPRLPLPGEEATDTAADVADESDAGVADAPAAPVTDESAATDTTDAGVPAVESDPRRVVTAPAAEGSFITDLLSNVWLWLSAAVVLVLALLVARRRRHSGDADQTGAWKPDTDADATDTGMGRDYEETMRDLQNLKSQDPSIVVEEQERAGDTQRNEAFRPQDFDEGLDFPADDTGKNPFIDDDSDGYAEDADTELPLEKTISTGAPLNLDQADPIAEAEFHMAYGLYDQAAELLERSLRSDPDNRAYRVKLIEVYFVWENREGFLREARRLHESVGDNADSDWSKVLILGKQLCPDEPLFAGAAPATTSDSMDFELGEAGESADTELDFTLGGNEVKALDGDFSGNDGDNDDESADELDIDFGDFGTGVSDKLELDLGEGDASDSSDADTLETPTVEIDSETVGDGGTLESPTVENWFDDATVESTALQDDDLPADDSEDEGISDTAATTETPTLENPMNEPTLESPTLESMGAGGETSEMPALDIEDFDPEAIEFETGGADDLDVDLSGLGAESADDATDDETEQPGDDDATLLAGLDVDFDALNEEESSDTVQQPPVDASSGDTAEQPAISSPGDLDFSFDEEDPEEDMPTAIAPGTMLPEDATMTEVGTKLDLARAYIDMGDPDGARSILNEVLDEGGKEQQQQARQLLEELGD